MRLIKPNPRRLPFILTLLAFVLTACRPAHSTAPTTEFSAGDWQTSTPAAEGMDAKLLANFLARAELFDLNSVLVIRHGRIVAEGYSHGFSQTSRQEMYSVTKSFTGTLVGIAIDQGFLRLDEPVLPIFPDKDFANVDARKQAMTVEDLLTMTSGLDWREGEPAYRAISASPDWVKYVLDLPMVSDPGTTFNYCSGCSHVLMAIVQAKTGQPALEFANQNLLAPIGIIDPDWGTDSQGLPVGGWGIQLTAREMARLGFLYLHLGKWGIRQDEPQSDPQGDRKSDQQSTSQDDRQNGIQFVSEDWVKAATQGYSTLSNELAYGYQWWIYPPLQAYAALGL